MRHAQLKAFHHVALLGGFSRAAEALFLTQPAISEQVRKLEQAHDVLLFHREGRRIRLTPAGQRLFRLTRQYFELEQQITAALSDSRAALAGELRIIADSAHHVTGLLAAFRARHPGVTVTLRAGNTQEILDALRAYEAEIGVVGRDDPGRDMAVLRLGATRIIAFAARGLLPGQRSLELAELARLPLVFREQGSRTRRALEEAARDRGLTLKPAIIAEGREAVRELVASGAGVGVVSEAEFGHDARLVRLPIRDAELEMRETLVHLAQRRDVPVIRAFMEQAWRVVGGGSTGG